MSSLLVTQAGTWPLWSGMAPTLLRCPRPIGLWVVGGLAIVAVPALASWAELDFATSAFASLIIVVLLSFVGGVTSSLVFSLISLASLSYFSVEPRLAMNVSDAHDILRLMAFVLTSMAVTGLMRRVRSLGEETRSQAALLDLTTDSVMVRDERNIITYWNRGAEELYGWSAAEAVGKDAADLLKTEYPVALSAIQESLDRSGRWDGELVNRSRDGDRVVVASRWSRQLDAAGRPTGTLECGTDLTERRRAEDAVRATQSAYLAEAQRLSRTGSFGWNTASGAISWSDETFRIFGVEPGRQPTLELVLSRVHPEDVDTVRKLLETAATDAGSFEQRHRLRMPDGTVKHVEVRARALSDPTGGVQYVGAVMDVTASAVAFEKLENSEQRYRHLFNHMPVGIWQLDGTRLVSLLTELRKAGVSDLGAYFDENPSFVQTCMDALIIEDVNERGLHLFGGHDPAEFNGISCAPCWTARPDTFRRAIESRYRGEESYEEETQMVTLDGRVLDVLFATARVGYAGRPNMSLVGVVDISQRVLLQQRLQEIQAEFAHAARISTLGELTASIAHEINQPIAAISTQAGAGLRWLDRPEPDAAEIRSSLEAVKSEAARARDIVARIKSMAGGRAPERSCLSLDEILAESLGFLRGEFLSKQVSVVHDRAATAPLVLGDRTQLQQVFVNLAVNAMQAMVEAGCERRRIVVSTRVSGTEVLCTVEDTGPGIEEAHIARLFDSFFTTKKGGMGMGLRICRTIIEAHEGRIAAENSRGGGMRFAVILPAAQPAG